MGESRSESRRAARAARRPAQPSPPAAPGRSSPGAWPRVRVLGKAGARSPSAAPGQHQHMGRGAGVGGRTEPVHPLPARLLAHDAGHRAHGNPLGVHAAQAGGQDQRPQGERVAIGHAAELEPALALRPSARRRHHAEAVAARGERAHPEIRVRPGHPRCSSGETLRTTPISPSGATTGWNGATPSRAPTLSSSIRPSVACDWCSTSAGT